MFGVRVFVAQNICLLYLSISSCILMLCKFFGGNLEFLEEKLFPPDVPRINPDYAFICCRIIGISFSRTVTKHLVTDGQKDGRTDRISTAKTALDMCLVVKMMCAGPDMGGRSPDFPLTESLSAKRSNFISR